MRLTFKSYVRDCDRGDAFRPVCSYKSMKNWITTTKV